MRRNPWLKILFPVVIVLLLLVIFWNWDWFIPIVDAEASASLGRKVTVQHLHVRLGGPRSKVLALIALFIDSDNLTLATRGVFYGCWRF